MALIKIYSEPKNDNQINLVAKTIKLICSAALNCDDIPTNLSQVETVKATGIDLIGIDFILEIVGCERQNKQEIANNIITGLNAVYPDLFFSVYFNIIKEDGMSATPRQNSNDNPISMNEAINLSKSTVI